MGYGDISAFNENCPFKTPNFDAMCENGLRFTDAHASSAVCTPSRYSILTGRYKLAVKTEIPLWWGIFGSHFWRKEEKTVADLFREQAIIRQW